MQAKENAELGILRLLREGRSPAHISGEEISRRLGISRTAVWKHVRNLRGAGYRISASPSKGYLIEAAPRPFNALEISAGLETEFTGRRIFFYPVADSTNAVAMKLGRLGEAEGAAVVADSQVSGKGRLGRRWVSPAGVNLYTSIILRPRIPLSHAQRLTLLMAVAVAGTAAEFSAARPAVKWPNDILIGGKKAAGILLEMDAEPDRVNFIVAGIGVNINMDCSSLPPEVRQNAASIGAPGKEVSRALFAQRLYSNVERWYKIFMTEGFAPVIRAWNGFFDSEGKPVRVNVFGRTVEGIAAGIDADGMLLVRTPSGGMERIISGDTERVSG